MILSRGVRVDDDLLSRKINIVFFVWECQFTPFFTIIRELTFVLIFSIQSESNSKIDNKCYGLRIHARRESFVQTKKKRTANFLFCTFENISLLVKLLRKYQQSKCYFRETVFIPSLRIHTYTLHHHLSHHLQSPYRESLKTYLFLDLIAALWL